MKIMRPTLAAAAPNYTAGATAQAEAGKKLLRFNATVVPETGKGYEYVIWAYDLASAMQQANQDAPPRAIAVTVEPHPEQTEAVKLGIAELEPLVLETDRTYGVHYIPEPRRPGVQS